MKPQPTEAEIQFILDAISEYLTVKVGICGDISGVAACAAFLLRTQTYTNAKNTSNCVEYSP